MKHFIGIDLGTTNSVICSFNGSETRIWKSPEQNDVTPSAIYIDRRGNKYVGRRAYDAAPQSPDNTAMLFKRFMGTSTPINMKAINLTMKPEECSAEVLKVLFGYLPEEIRNSSETGTVITVPAAFNQMQKDATMQAANLAGIGKVAIMQEPVAAVMSVIRSRNTEGMFLIFDLGGGTLDIAIAESTSGRVNLLAHGGIAMCGGRDFDRLLVEHIVRPWLLDTFNLPEDYSTDHRFKSLDRLAAWAAERAKIELSAREEAVINLPESEARLRDLDGNDIYIEIPLQREAFDTLINPKIMESVEAGRETLSKAGVSANDLERIVFVGGPTNHKSLRDRIALELGIPGSFEVNPMTAVAEGACLFAESIDWDTQSRTRKSGIGRLSTGGRLALTFNYIARTPTSKTKIVVQSRGSVLEGSEFQIDSLDTGWTSGKRAVKDGASIEVSLSKMGENTFKVFVFDSLGGPISIEKDKITIVRTAATVDAIPASHSIAIAALEKLGGAQVLEYLIRAGDPLPNKGKTVFKAAESLKAGSTNSLNFHLWEGEIEEPITDNRPIGVFKISGTDFHDGVIPAGGDLECTYEILDSGNIIIGVSVPSIRGMFDSAKNFYSRQEGQLDFTSSAALVIEEGEDTLRRLDAVSSVVDDPRLEQAREKLETVSDLDPEESEIEKNQEARENILKARKILDAVRKDHRKEIRQLELDGVVEFFNQHIREHARPSEATSFDNLVRTAQRSIDRNDKDFEHHLDELKGKNMEILWRQDWFVVERFKWMVNSPYRFAEKNRYEELINAGMQYLRADDIDKLRHVVAMLSMMQIGGESDSDILDVVNVVRG